MMVAYIDAHRDTHGIEPICALLPTPRRRIGATKRSRPIRRSDRRARSGMTI
jgi:hypothetical protein